MYLDIEGKKYEVVILKKNIKNVYIRVKDDLKIYISTNKYTTNKMIEKLINDNYKSIVSMVNKKVKKLNDHDKYMILGKEVNVIEFSYQDKIELYNNKLYVKDINKLDKYIKEYAYDIFKERLNYIYNMFIEKIPYPKLKIRKMTSRWGVCNRKDNSITLNLELIRMDVKYLDYVIVHELSHFVYFDHSKNFWNIVSKYCSNYKTLRKEMRE